MPLKHNLIKNVWFHFLFVKNSNSYRYFFLKKAGWETLGEFRATNLVFSVLFELQLCTVCGQKDVCFEPRCTLVVLFCWEIMAWCDLAHTSCFLAADVPKNRHSTTFDVCIHVEQDMDQAGFSVEYPIFADIFRSSSGAFISKVVEKNMERATHASGCNT